MRKKVIKIIFFAPALLFFTFFLIPGGFAFAQSLSPVQPHARLGVGVNLYSQGRWREAVLELRKVQAEANSNELRAEALFWISLSELSAGEYEEALRDMETLEQIDPTNRRREELPYHRGRALYHLGHYNEAIVLLRRYSDSIVPGPGGILNSQDSSRKAAAIYWTGECLFSMGQLDIALEIFRRVTDEYPGSSKYEASLYRIDLINQKKVESELLSLLKWTHEESLRNTEEFRRREATYEQALGTYQRRIAEMLRDTRLQDLENENTLYKEQIESAEARIRSLENTLKDTSSTLEQVRHNTTLERLRTLKSSAQDLENRIRGN